MTRRRDVAAEDDAGAAAARRLLRAGVHARRQDLVAAPREGHARWTPRRTCAMIAESVGVPARRRASASIYDAEHFFDALPRRPRLRAALPAGRGRGGRRERDAVRHQRLVAARRRSRDATARVVRRAGRVASRSASTPTTTPAAAWPTRSWRSSAGARLVQGTMNGYGERCGNANLVTILPALQLKLGYECVARGAAARA